MRLVFIICCLSLGPLYAETKKPGGQVTSLMKKGHIFDHYEIQDECKPRDLCEKESPLVCQSQKAKFLRCSEQYKENWIITCICL